MQKHSAHFVFYVLGYGLRILHDVLPPWQISKSRLQYEAIMIWPDAVGTILIDGEERLPEIRGKVAVEIPA